MTNDRLSELVGWYAFEDDRIVALWDGSYMTTFALRGPDMDMKSEEERIRHSERIGDVWRSLGSGWSFHLEAQNTALASYQPGKFPTAVSALVDAERRRDCEKEGAQFEMRHYLTLTQSPKSANVLSQLFTSGNGDSARKRQRERFKRQSQEVFDALRSIVNIDKMSDDRIVTYLKSTISTNRHKVRAADHEVLSDSLPDQRFQRRLGLSKLGDDYIAVLTLGGFPRRSNPQLLHALNKLPFEFSWVTRWVGMDAAAAKNLMKQREEKALGSAIFAKDVFVNGIDNWRNKGQSKPLRGHIRERSDREELKHADAAASAMESLSDRGYGHMTVVFKVTDKDPVRCREKRDELATKLRDDPARLVVRVEDIEPFKPWCMAIPGNRDTSRRTFPVSTRNVADLMPTTSTFRGAPADAQMAKTTGVSRAWLQTCDPETYRQNSDSKGGAAHEVVFGRTGEAGKSTFVNLKSLLFFGWPKAQVISFSVGRSEFGPCLMSGGVVYSFGDRGSPALQPLAHVDYPDAALDANEWLQQCVECVGEKVTPERRLAIEDGVKLLAAEPPARRTMTAMVDYLTSRAPDLADVLRPYTHHGVYGHIFDGCDGHKFEFKPWTMFDLSHLAKMRPEAQAPAIGYLMKRVRKRFDGRPTLVPMDECADWLHLPGLEREAIRMLDTDRKNNVRLLLVAQSPDQIRKRLPNMLASVQSAAQSRVFGADSSASEQAEAYASFGVTPVMLKRIKKLARGSFVHVLGPNAREFKLNANALQLAIAGSSESDDLAMFAELRDRCCDGDDIMREWLKHKRLAHLAKDLGVWPESSKSDLQQAAE